MGTPMKKRWMAWIALALLAGCAMTQEPSGPHAWDGGIWNSVLGYHGPDNAIVVGGPR